MSDEELVAQRVKMIEAALSLGITLWVIWTLIPQHRRQLARMRFLASLRRSTDWAARRAGVASMRAELLTAQQNYALPYSLSLARDRLAAAYDRTRGITP